MKFEAYHRFTIVNGTHIFTNPANREVIDCPDLEFAKTHAKMMSVGFEETVTIYKFTMADGFGHWKKVWAYRNGRQAWALTKAVAA